MVFADLVKLCNFTTTSKSNNLSPHKIKALDELMHAEDLVIKTVDKGKGIVLQYKSDYIREEDRLLSDLATYIKLKEDPTTEVAKEAELLISTAQTDGIISKTES